MDAPHGNNTNVIIGIILVHRFLWPVCSITLTVNVYFCKVAAVPVCTHFSHSAGSV